MLWASVTVDVKVDTIAVDILPLVDDKSKLTRYCRGEMHVNQLHRLVLRSPFKWLLVSKCSRLVSQMLFGGNRGGNNVIDTFVCEVRRH